MNKKILFTILGILLVCLMSREICLYKTVRDIRQKYASDYLIEMNGLDSAMEKLENVCLYRANNTETCLQNLNKIREEKSIEISNKYSSTLKASYFELRKIVIENHITTSRK